MKVFEINNNCFSFNCKLKTIESFKDSNQTTKLDAITLLSENKSDIFFRREHAYMDNPNILFSNVVGYEYTVLSHVLDVKNKELTGNNLLNKFIISNFIITSILFTINLIFLIFLFGINLNFNLSRTFKKCLTILFNIEMLMDFNLGKRIIFLLFLNILLIRFFQEMTSNCIQFNQVIVDTDHIVKTKDEIFTTKKRMCWLNGEKDIYLFQNSANNTFINRVWRTRNLYRKINNKTELCKFNPDIFE